TRQRAENLLADLNLVAKLEDYRLYLADGRSPSARVIDQEYAKAFREFGIDVELLETTEAADRIQTRSVAVELATALDTWAMMRKVVFKMNDRSWKRLLAIARVVDSDPERNRLRAVMERGGSKALEQCARSNKIRAWPVSTMSG